ncbi:hypothetical protein CKM354_000882900 [Cercospora kikuchii]|uniref:Uncharacterized protein n=1 Tax=Cercospora kikuchii TaxID=84275 RepID=A0A9P3CM03_9PEZI|nr:uncharacterized protein CKM354_000882900 [Cercospora kikuchii]GIZ45672.1 hypothetical protein CKM354_000882900 [Cercospora kikuchii]
MAVQLQCAWNLESAMLLQGAVGIGMRTQCVPEGYKECEEIPELRCDSFTNTSAQSVVLIGYEGCDKIPNGHAFLREGFESMNKLAMPMDPINRGDPQRYKPIDWKSAAAIEFFGPGYKTGQFDVYRETIQKNMDRLASTDSAFFLGWRLHVRCDDPKNECSCFDGTETEAYTMHDDKYKDQINFCPRYFELKSLEQAVHADKKDQKNFDVIKKYWNRSCVWAHEILHVSWLGTPANPIWPYMQDQQIEKGGIWWRAYRVLDVKYLAYSRKAQPWEAINNPQNYAFFALANYVQEVKGFYPSAAMWWWPRDDPPDVPSVTSANSGRRRCGEDMALDYAANRTSSV